MNLNESAKVLDVSHHQNPLVDWGRAQVEDGISGMLARYGYGIALDETFDDNFTNARAAGLRVGSYYFPNADRDVDEQVQLYVSSPYHEFDLPMGVDVEYNPFSTKQQNEAMIRRFCDELERITGKLPSIYTSANQWHTLIGRNKTWASKYPLHVAHYTSDSYPDLPDVFSSWYLWQHKVAPLNSYPKNVDQNRYNGTVNDLCCQYTHSDFKLDWPVDSEVVTQEFGKNPIHYGPLLGAPGMGHEGIDFRGNLNDPIWACADGVVAERYFDESYGNLIVLDHQNGFKTLYAHMNKLSSLTLGTRVSAGDRIGGIGTTGASTGTHLHLTLYHNDAERISVYPKKKRGYIINPTGMLVKPSTVPVYVPIRSINTINMNIRSTPEITTTNDIGDILPNSTLEGVPTAETWWRIRYQGIEGWALAEYLQVIDQPPVSLRGTASPHVNIRAGQSTGFTDLGDVYFGEIVQGWPVTGQSWWKVVKGSVTGWVLAEYLEIV